MLVIYVSDCNGNRSLKMDSNRLHSIPRKIHESSIQVAVEHPQEADRIM